MDGDVSLKYRTILFSFVAKVHPYPHTLLRTRNNRHRDSTKKRAVRIVRVDQDHNHKM